MWQQCNAEVYDPRKTPWEQIKDDVVRIEQAQFGTNAFSEGTYKFKFDDPNGTHVLLWDTSRGEVVGVCITQPAEPYYKRYHPERLFDIVTLDAPTAYIWNTVIDPAYTGQGLVGVLMTTLEEALVKKGYGYLDRDAAVANNYAANIAKAYADRIISQYLHDSAFGPQMFFRIRLRS